jgi:hypothetical protein
MAIAQVTEFLEVELVGCMNLTPINFSGEIYQFLLDARKSQFPEIYPALVLMAADTGKFVPETLMALDRQLSFSL